MSGIVSARKYGCCAYNVTCDFTKLNPRFFFLALFFLGIMVLYVMHSALMVYSTWVYAVYGWGKVKWGKPIVQYKNNFELTKFFPHTINKWRESRFWKCTYENHVIRDKDGCHKILDLYYLWFINTYDTKILTTKANTILTKRMYVAKQVKSCLTLPLSLEQVERNHKCIFAQLFHALILSLNNPSDTP